MSEVKWIKITTDMFDDEKIKLIESLPEADTILIIWVKLLAQAGKTNASGHIFLSENVPYTEEMLATLFNRPLNVVRFALETLKEFDMIDIDEKQFIKIKNWEKHQNIEGMERIREQNRLRKRKERDRKKAARVLEGNEKLCDVTGLSRDSHATEVEREVEREKEKENNNNNKSLVVLPHDKRRKGSKQKKKQNQEHVPIADIVTYLNEKAGKNFKSTTNMTREKIQARWREGFRLEDFHKVIDYCVNEWKGKDFGNGRYGDEYLRPSTLFNQKFEDRLDKAENDYTRKRPKMKYFSGDVNELFGDV